MSQTSLPVAVIGAGPIGLAAAAHLVSRGETPVVLEAGESVGASILKWAHVRVFSPWQYATDRAAVALLEATGWSRPPADGLPTGGELFEQYLRPLAELPEIAPHLRLNTKVLSVARQGFDKMKSAGREEAPFVLRVSSDCSGDCMEEEILAKAVIDASGTYATPNPLGGNGVPAIGEATVADRVAYGIPDVLGPERDRYAGRRVMVVGSGHSAFNALIDLSLFSELRVELDPSVEAPTALAPLIDPNVHSCGSVPPHGEAELRQPETGFYVVGMKSYGRAPTFLMLTGYEQARSVVAAIRGDMEAARNVELVLPETGVCSTDLDGPACCGSEPTEAATPVETACCGSDSSPAAVPTSSACCGPAEAAPSVPNELPVLAGVGAGDSDGCCR